MKNIPICINLIIHINYPANVKREQIFIKLLKKYKLKKIIDTVCGAGVPLIYIQNRLIKFSTVLSNKQGRSVSPETQIILINLGYWNTSLKTSLKV